MIGASGGIGSALAHAMNSRGDHVTGLSQSINGLDITCERSIGAALAPFETPFDVVIIASGILSGPEGPEKSISALNSENLARLFAVNAMGPALVLKHIKRLMPTDRPSVVVALSARVGSITDNALGGWYSYRASKAALNQIIKTASIEFKRSHKHLVCAALHPGTVATSFTQNFPRHKMVPPGQAAENLLTVIDGLTSRDTGCFFDWSGQMVDW